MTGRAREDKPRRNHKQYLAVQLIANLIGAAVVVAFLSAVARTPVPSGLVKIS
jgi:hypothetical protein